MRYRARLLVLLSLSAATAVSVIGASTVWEPQSPVATDSGAVAMVVNDFHAALSRGDSARALSLLAADAVILESGTVESRSEYRSHHLPEDIKFAKSVASKRRPLQITVEGSSAWTATASRTRGRFSGKMINTIDAESMVLTKHDGSWRIRSIHWS